MGIFKKLGSQLSLTVAFPIQFGHIYSDDEINKQKIKVAQIKRKFDRIPDEFFDIKKRLVVFSRDYPKLSLPERQLYKRFKALDSKISKEYIPEEQKVKWMELSRVIDRQPTVEEIMEFSEEIDEVPSIAAKKFGKKYPLYPYHPYLINLGRAMFDYHHKFVQNFTYTFDNAPSDVQVEWVEKAVLEEDKKWGNGSTPLQDEVRKNQIAFGLLVKQIEIDEKDYIQDAVKSHLGKGTKKFSKEAIKAITQGEDVGESTFAGMYDYDVEEYNQMGGFFSSILKKVMSPVEKLAISPFMKTFNKVASPALKKVLPSHLHSSLSNLTQASANILAGKISKKNLRKAVKASIRVAGSAGEGMMKPIQIAHKVNSKYNPVYKTVDKYSGGVLTSVDNISRITNDVARGNKIDVMARTVDGIKIGMTVGAYMTGGATAALMPTVTNMLTAKTSIGDSSLGRAGLRVGGTLATGGVNAMTSGSNSFLANAMQKELNHQMERTIREKAEKKGLGKNNKTVGLLLKSAEGADSPQEIAENFAKEVAKTEAGKQIEKRTGSTLVSMVGKAAVKAGLNQTDSDAKFTEDFNNEVKYGVKKEATAKTNQKIKQKTGVNADITAVNKMSNQESNKVLEDVKKMAKKELVDFAREHSDLVLERIGNERVKTAMEMVEYYKDYEKTKKRLEEFDAQEELAQLEKDAEKKIAEKQAKLGKEIARIESDYAKAMQKVNSNTPIDMNKIINDEAGRMKQKALAERDDFEANWRDKLYGLKDKYGDQMLAYLMWKYGPQRNYDQFITQEDYQYYMYWTPPQDGRKYRTNYGIGTKLALGALGVTAAYMLIG